VVQQDLAQGEAVQANADVFTIADLSRVWAAITVYARDLDSVQIGQTIAVKAADTGFTSGGTAFYVGPLVGVQTRSAKAYVEIPNPERRWRRGLFVTVEVLQEKVEVPVAVVAEAVQTHQDRPVVFVQHENLFEVRPVTLGRRDGEWVEVREGLSAPGVDGLFRSTESALQRFMGRRRNVAPCAGYARRRGCRRARFVVPWV